MDMHEQLRLLSKKRPVFHSEADFQHALAWELHLASNTSSIRLEQQVDFKKNRIHLDLLVKDQTQHIAIELKYKTKNASISYREEKFNLCNQSAQDIGRYDFLKDIQRIEHYVSTHSDSEGYTILLTNDSNYWKESKRGEPTVDAAFRIHEGRPIHGKLEWRAGTSKGTMRSREAAIDIKGQYVLEWKDFSQIEQCSFRYVLVHVPSNPN